MTPFDSAASAGNAVLLSVFGTPAQYYAQGNPVPVSLRAVVSLVGTSESAFPGHFADIDVYECETVPAGITPAVEDLVLLSGITYRVRVAIPAGDGKIVLSLHKKRATVGRPTWNEQTATWEEATGTWENPA